MTVGRGRRRLLILLSGVLTVLLLGAAGLLVWGGRLLDPETLRRNLIDLAQEQHGLILEMATAPRVTRFPRLGVRMGPLILRRPGDPVDRPLLQVELALAHIRLAPLLQGRVVLGTMVLTAPELNWDGPLNALLATESGEETGAAPVDEGRSESAGEAARRSAGVVDPGGVSGVADASGLPSGGGREGVSVASGAAVRAPSRERAAGAPEFDSEEEGDDANSGESGRRGGSRDDGSTSERASANSGGRSGVGSSAVGEVPATGRREGSRGPAPAPEWLRRLAETAVFEGLVVRNGAVRLRDPATGLQVTISRAALNLGAVADGRQTPFRARFHARSSDPDLSVELEGEGLVTPDLSRGRLFLHRNHWEVGLAGAALPEGVDPLSLELTVDGQAPGGPWRVERCDLSAPAISFQGRFTLKDPFSFPSVRGAGRATIKRPELLLAATPPALAAQPLALTSTFTWFANHLALSEMTLTRGDDVLMGEALIGFSGAGSLMADLSGDSLDLAAVLPALLSGAPSGGTGPAAGPDLSGTASRAWPEARLRLRVGALGLPGGVRWRELAALLSVDSAGIRGRVAVRGGASGSLRLDMRTAGSGLAAAAGSDSEAGAIGERFVLAGVASALPVPLPEAGGGWRTALLDGRWLVEGEAVGGSLGAGRPLYGRASAALRMADGALPGVEPFDRIRLVVETRPPGMQRAGEGRLAAALIDAAGERLAAARIASWAVAGLLAHAGEVPPGRGQLEGVYLNGWRGRGFRQATWRSPLRWGRGAEPVTLDWGRLRIGGQTIEARAKFSGLIPGRPAGEAHWRAAALDLAALADFAGVDPPPPALLALADRARWTAGMTIEPDRLQFDVLTLTGSRLSLTGRLLLEPQRRRARFDLRGGPVDLDPLLAAAAPDAARAASASVGGTGGVFGAGAGSRDGPDAAWRALDVSGNLALERLWVAGLELDDVRLKAGLQAGRVWLDPLQARLGGGELRLTLKGALGEETPGIRFEGTLSNARLETLLAPFTAEIPARGGMDLFWNLSARGADPDAWRSAVEGQVNLKLARGALRQASAEGEEDGAVREFAFDQGMARIQARRGRFVNRDFLLSGPWLKARGAGWFDLGEDAVAYRINASLGETLDIPIAVEGALSAPAISVGTDEMVGGVFRNLLSVPLRLLEWGSLPNSSAAGAGSAP